MTTIDEYRAILDVDDMAYDLRREGMDIDTWFDIDQMDTEDDTRCE